MALVAGLLVFGGSTVAATAEPPEVCADVPKIAKVYVDEKDRKTMPGSTAPAAFLNDRIKVSVCALDKLFESAESAQKGVSLFINGADAGIKPSDIDRQGRQLSFVLHRTPQNSELWKPLLSNPLGQRGDHLRISVGLAGGVPLEKLGGADTALPFNKLWIDGWTYAAAVLVVLVVALTAYFGKNSNMLRDGATVDGVRQAYSLARVQMAWWFVLVVAGFIVILLVTGDTDSIPATIVALTGISATTGVAAVLLTPSAAQRAAARKAELSAQSAVLADGITDIDAALAAADQQLAAAGAAGQPADTLAALKQGLQVRRAARIAESDALVLRLTALSSSNPSAGFWQDLVTNEGGAVALDRLQMVVWTVLLGGLYLHSVLIYVTMPDFSPTLLALVGVSSGTYIGFKLPSANSG